MKKSEILAKFAAGFVVGKEPYQDNLVVDEINTMDDELRLWAYDANLMPTNFASWADPYRKQVVEEVLCSRRIRESDVAVFIDGVQIRKRDSVERD